MQATINFQEKLENHRLKDGDDWAKHLNKFNEIPGKLSLQDSPVSEKDKQSKLVRTLPESFAPLSMVIQSNNVKYEHVVNAVQLEKARTKFCASNEKVSISSASMASVRGRRNKETKEGRVMKRNSDDKIIL